MEVAFNNLYAAQVVDNDDPQKEGRVKIFIPSIMEGWNPTHLPWARPFFNSTGGDFGKTSIAMYCVPTSNNNPKMKSFTFGDSRIPEKNTNIWVWFEKDRQKKNAYYMTGIQLSKSSPHKSFINTVAQTIPEIKGKYPDIKYTILANGICVFHSSDLKVLEAGTFETNDTYFFQQDDRTTNQQSKQLTRLMAGTDNKIEMKGDEAAKTSSILLSNDTNSFIKQSADKTASSFAFKTSVDQTTFMELKSSNGGTQRNFEVDVGPSDKITLDGITHQAQIIASQMVTLQSSLVSVTGQLNVATTVQTPGVIAPPSPGAAITIQGTSSPGPANDPAVKGNEYTITMTQIIAAINSLASAASQLSAAIVTMSNGFLFPTGANVTAAAQATAALTDVSSASSSASSATSSLPNGLSTNVLIN